MITLKLDKTDKKILSWLRKSASKINDGIPILQSMNVLNGTAVSCDKFRVHSIPTPESLKEHTGKVLQFTTNTLQDINEFEELPACEYPNIEQVKPMGDFTFRVGVNPKLLIDALSGFDGMVSLTFYGDTKPFYVKDTDAGNPDQWALIMPVYLDENGHT